MSAEDLRNSNTNGARENRLQNWQGIKFFHGQSLLDTTTLRELVTGVTADYLREQKHVWRPEETVEAAVLFFGLQKSPDQRLGIRVIGPPQSGKGTILFGLSEICDTLGIGYVFIDGHHQEVDGGVVAKTIAQAQRMNIPIFFDSFDYLFLRSRATGRSIPKEDQARRAQLIMKAIGKTTVPIAITGHGEEWDDEFLDLQLQRRYQPVFDPFPMYTLPLMLQSEASVQRFLLDHRIPEPVVAYLLKMSKEEQFSALKTYPVLKELARSRAREVVSLVEEILLCQGDVTNLAALIQSLDQTRRNLTQIRRKRLKVI